MKLFGGLMGSAIALSACTLLGCSSDRADVRMDADSGSQVGAPTESAPRERSRTAQAEPGGIEGEELISPYSGERYVDMARAEGE